MGELTEGELFAVLEEGGYSLTLKEALSPLPGNGAFEAARVFQPQMKE